MLIIRTIIKNIITLMVIATVFGCSNPAEDKEYPKIYYTGHSSITYLNDSIVVVSTHVSGLDNYETKIINLKKK